MFYHFLLVGWRNLQRYRVSAGIGVVGLAMGLVCFVFCSYCARLYFGTDKSFPNYERLAEVQLKVGEGDRVQDFFAGTPPTLAGFLENDFPGLVECFTVVSYAGEMNATFEKPDEEKVTYNLNTIEVDRNFKTVFSCRLLAGNWEQMFRQRNAVVLSRSAARKIFGDGNPLGSVFHPNEFTFRTTGIYTPEDRAAIGYTVVGVMEDLPLNASFSLLVPVDALFINDEHGLFLQYTPEGGGSGCTTFALLRPGVDRTTVNRRIHPEKHRTEIGGMGAIPVFLSPGKNNIEYYRLLGYSYWGVGLLILLVAGLNFFTFMMGNFFNRIREYNIRKGIGGTDRQLFGLLFTETLLLLIPVGIVVACLVELLYAHLDFSLTRRSIVFQSTELYVQLLEYMGTGVVACAAVCWGIGRYVSRKYMRVGIGNGMKRAGKQRMRNVMLGIQLVITLLFFTGGSAVYLQSEVLAGNMFSSLTEEEKERILEVGLTYPQVKGLEMSYIERMKQIPGVAEVLITDYNLLGIMGNIAAEVGGNYREIEVMKAGKNFAAFLNLPMLAGVVFQYPGQAVADRKLDALYGGKLVEKGFEDIDGVKINVCGVVESIPEIYAGRRRLRVWSMSEKPAWCYLKVYPGAQARVGEEVRKMLREVVPETMELRVSSWAKVIREENRREEQTKSMLLFFTVVCLAITVLGIYSAIRIDSERRQKEIAIRKINGASSYRIAGLFLRLYLKLLLIAVIIVFPLLWWIIRLWLSLFTVRFYHGIGFWISVILVVAGVIALTIAWKVRQIIRTDPVKVLRSE